MFLPLHFKTKQLSCLIIGGGNVAAHKVEILTSAGCPLTVVAPVIDSHIRHAVERSQVRWHARAFEAGDCAGFQLVIAATPHRAVNRMVSEEARSLGIPVNVVDDPELCTVFFGAIWQDGPLTISVSSGGTAPFMARALRDGIARAHAGMGAWVDAAAHFRAAVRNEVTDVKERSRLYRRFADKAESCPPDSLPQSTLLLDWLNWLESRSSDP
jgi:uroporphyrin-III C-methyltransferase/precorrin-2 dehydrogenase/sirohydrochlorin ferrochelatase